MALTIQRLTAPAPPQARTLFARVWAASLPGPAPALTRPTAGEALSLAWQARQWPGIVFFIPLHVPHTAATHQEMLRRTGRL